MSQDLTGSMFSPSMMSMVQMFVYFTTSISTIPQTTTYTTFTEASNAESGTNWKQITEGKKEQKKKSSLSTNLIRRRSRHRSMYARCSAVEAGGKLGTSRTTSTHRFPSVAMPTFFCTPFLSLTTPRLREPSDSPLPRRRSGCLRGNRRRLASAGGRLSGGGSGGAHGPRREARVWASKRPIEGSERTRGTEGEVRYLLWSGERFLQISPYQSINFILAYTCNA